MTFFTASDDGRAVDGVVTWPPVDVAVGDVLTRTVRVRIAASLPPGLTELVNTAEAPVTGDAEPADNRFDHVLPIAQQTDVAVDSVDVSGAATDPQSLAITGQVAVELTNLGTVDASGFDVAVFEDLDGDGAYTAGADNLLGTASVAVLAPGEVTSLPVPVSGTVLFRDNRVFAYADSGQVLAELDETNNLGQSAAGCQAVPPPGDFAPVVELSWPVADTVESYSADCLSTPLVVQLTDDNGDGRRDERDVPDLVFVTYDLSYPLNPTPRLRAIRGDTGATLWDAYPPISGYFQTFALTGAAAGDIDLDGRPEIVVSTFDTRSPSGRPNHLAAYEHNGTLKWVSSSYSTHPDGDTLTNRDNPTIADLDGDGRPEIVVGANVFNANGSLRWAGTGGQGYQSARNDDAFDSGAISIVADLDLDGAPEVVTGNTAYRADGTIWWQVPYDDGYPAVADFDADPEPEIVVVSRGFVRLHEHDGTLLWEVELPGTGAEAGGAPTVADFDGDGEPEIGVAGSTQYTVFEGDGTVKWQAPTQDGSSNMTGSTVFDLDGDGRFEVVYRDETRLRIYRGEDGVVLYELPLSSTTLNEQPVVADVDRDGNAEIVVTSDLADGIGVPSRTRGLRVIGDAADHWVAARPVWNEHAYHISNVAEDSYTIPAHEDPSWLAHNTYRANVAPVTGAFASPDLSASAISIDVSGFPEIRATVRIGNGGTVFSGAGTTVAFYDGDPTAGGALLATVPVGRELDPGELADVAFSFQASAYGAAELYARADDDGTGAGSQTECDEANNLHGVVYDTDALGLVLTKDDGSSSVQPGEVVTYTLSVTNAASTPRTGVALTDSLPPSTTLVAASDGAHHVGRHAHLAGLRPRGRRGGDPHPHPPGRPGDPARRRHPDQHGDGDRRRRRRSRPDAGQQHGERHRRGADRPRRRRRPLRRRRGLADRLRRLRLLGPRRHGGLLRMGLRRRRPVRRRHRRDGLLELPGRRQLHGRAPGDRRLRRDGRGPGPGGRRQPAGGGRGRCRPDGPRGRHPGRVGDLRRSGRRGRPYRHRRLGRRGRRRGRGRRDGRSRQRLGIPRLSGRRGLPGHRLRARRRRGERLRQSWWRRSKTASRWWSKRGTSTCPPGPPRTWAARATGWSRPMA